MRTARVGVWGGPAFLLLLAAGFVAGAGKKKPPLPPNTSAVHLDPRGKLVYTPDARGDTIPDFSRCGYEGGGVTLPNVAVRATVAPVSGDAGQTIQAALDRVSALPLDKQGIRGAVLLKRGTYRIAGRLRIQAGGVVLRGEGAEDGGTVLVATGKGKRTLIEVAGRGKWAEVRGSSRAVADAYVPVGARSFRLESAAGLKPGDRIIVHRPSTKNWIHALGMDRLPPRKNGGKVVQWAPGSKDLSFDRVITAVEGSRIRIDAPVTCALDSKYGGGSVYKYEFPGRIRQVGIEGLRGVSEFKGATDEDHAWIFIQLQAVENAWVRNVTAVHFGFAAVSVGGGAKWVTVQDCSCLDPVSQITGGRRYSFNLGGGQLTLWQHCHARNGRHDFVTGALVAGPSVFLDCTAEKPHADAGPHHRWAVGILYDNVHTAGALNVRNRGNLGTGHGWSGANHVFWNCKAAEITCEKPPTADNWAVGCTAKQRKGDGTWQTFDQPVKPASLYRAQLAERLARAKKE